MNDTQWKKLESDFVKAAKKDGGSNDAYDLEKAYQTEWRRRYHAKGGKLPGLHEAYQQQKAKLGLPNLAKKAPAKKGKRK